MKAARHSEHERKVIDRISLLKLARETVVLRRGEDGIYTGACPFHFPQPGRSTLRVNARRKFFVCSARHCQAAGDVVGWVQRLRGYTFLEAWEKLLARDRDGGELLAMSEQRNVVHIAAASVTYGDKNDLRSNTVLYALCDDGTIWRIEPALGQEWARIPGVPNA